MRFRFSPSVTRKLGRVSLAAKKHGPTIAVVGGATCMVAGTVWACVKTPQAREIIEEGKEDIAEIHAIHNGDYVGINEDIPVMDDKQYRISLLKAYCNTGLKVLKVYSLPILLEGVGLAGVLGGHGMLRKNYISLGTAYAGLKGSYDALVKRVDDHCSKEDADYIKYGAQKKEITTVNEKGKEKKETVTVIGEDDKPTTYSPYAKFFEQGNSNWTKSPEANLFFLTRNQAWATERLRRKGHLFLNEVYDQLGFERTAAGQHVGWMIKKDPTTGKDMPIGDDYVDFGIHNFNLANRRFVNGYEPVILLDFNVVEIVDEL